MAAELLSFFRPAVSVSGDWSSQEIAEFYRVEAALVQAGVSVSVGRGVSDEGDPWFVFCRATDGEVIVHFARIDGNYLIVADSIGRPLRGPNFRKVLADFVAINPTLIPIPSSSGAKLMLHPASLLAALVATALYQMSGTEAVANTLDPVAVDETHSPTHHAASFGILASFNADRKWSDWQVAAVVGAMTALAATEYFDSGNEIFANLASTVLDTANDHIVLPHSIIADASPISDLDGKVSIAGTLDVYDAHILFDNFILSGGGQAVSQQFQISSNDDLLQKFSASTTVSTQASDANVRGTDQSALVLSTSSGRDASAPTSVADPNHSNTALGSSTPDHTVVASSDAQTAVMLVNNELNAVSKTVPQIILSGNLSIQDVLGHGASDVFGFALPSTVVAFAGHSEGVDAGQVATTAVAQCKSSASSDSAFVSTASVSPTPSPSLLQQGTTYEPFNATANELLNAFVGQNNFEVLTSNNHVVLFDTNAADFSSPDFVVRTWSMSDGSTISIVGAVPHNLAIMA